MVRKKNPANADIRKVLVEKGIRHYEAAEACGVSLYTFSHWLQIEMKPEKKREVMETIRNIKV